MPSLSLSLSLSCTLWVARQALEQQEMFAIYPLKSCPHLSLLRPEEAPKCKRRSQQQEQS